MREILEHFPAALDNGQMEITRDGFSQRNRVRLIYLLADLMPGPSRGWTDGPPTGLALKKLDELLRFRLGVIELAVGGGDLETKIGRFILRAPDGEVLDLIELLPKAQYDSDMELHRALPSSFSRVWEQRLEEKLKSITETMNSFLEAIGSPAMFDQSLSFNRSPFEIEDVGPRSKIPKLDELPQDLTNTIASGGVGEFDRYRSR